MWLDYLKPFRLAEPAGESGQSFDFPAQKCHQMRISLSHGTVELSVPVCCTGSPEQH